MSGPAPTPSKKLKNRGTYRADRRNENEPTPPATMPEKPKWLKGKAAKEFDRLAPKLFAAGVLTAWDQGCFIALCHAWGQYVEALDLLEKDRTDKNKNPYITTTSNKNIIQNPMVGVANKALEKYQKLAAEFGLTPAARTKISVTTTPPPVGKDKSRFFSPPAQRTMPTKKKKAKAKKSVRKKAVKRKKVVKKAKKKKTNRVKK